jgi:hypothetical protein
MGLDDRDVFDVQTGFGKDSSKHIGKRVWVLDKDWGRIMVLVDGGGRDNTQDLVAVSNSISQFLEKHGTNSLAPAIPVSFCAKRFTLSGRTEKRSCSKILEEHGRAIEVGSAGQSRRTVATQDGLAS